jgi:predicted enzyme related to lactoylglutathione lyase
MNRPVHFEIHVPDCAAAIKFYEKTLGWQFKRFERSPIEYYLVRTGDGEGIDGGLMKSQDGRPRVVNAVQVASVDATVERIEAAGGHVVVEKMPIPGVGWVAYCTDPGGVLFGIYTHDESAA